MAEFVVAVTGASGAIYAVRLLHVLLADGHSVHLTISPSGAQVLRHELGLRVDLDRFEKKQILPPEHDLEDDSTLSNLCRPVPAGDFSSSSIFSERDETQGVLIYHHHSDFTAGIASGSFLTAGMVICPCSMGTLGSVAAGLASNLIHRAAEVHLKERRKLIVVPRETPVSGLQLEAMKRLADAGAVLLPAMPGFYHNPLTIHDLIDFIVGRICDHLGVTHQLCKRWGEA